MSGFFEAMGLTKSAPPQQQQQPQNTGASAATGGQPANPQTDPNAGKQPNGQPTPNSNVNGSNEIPDPMAAYAKMWDTPQGQQDAPPSLNLDSKILDQVAGNMDFMQGVDPELMQKAQTGDMQAIMQMMNAVARNAYRTSLQHSSALTDKFVGVREESFSKRVPNVVREELTLNTLNGGDTSGMSPTARKQLAVIAKQFQAQNPDASPSEVAAAAKKYVSDLYMQLNPQAAGGQAAGGSQQQSNEPFDWDKWADSQ